MNNLTAIVRIETKAEMRYTSNEQTPVTSCNLTLMSGYAGNTQELTIASVAWRKMAEQMTGYKPGTVLLVAGALNILSLERGDIKERVASLTISEAIELPGQALSPYNKVVLFGNVGQEVDAKYFESGKQNAKFSLAVRRTKEETDWFSIELWGKTAEAANQYVTKGSKVGILGSLKLETWKDRTAGADRSKPVIVGDRLELIGSKSEQKQSSTGYSEDF